MKRTFTTVLVIFLAAFFVGCSEPLTTREKGAGIGTLTGAGLGAIIGSATGHAGAGAGIGGAEQRTAAIRRPDACRDPAPL